MSTTALVVTVGVYCYLSGTATTLIWQNILKKDATEGAGWLFRFNAVCMGFLWWMYYIEPFCYFLADIISKIEKMKRALASVRGAE